MSTKDSSSIDWEEQWAAHSPGYRDGHLHIALENSKTVKLKSGPGFGDLSHATTNLMLQLMSPLVKGRHVLDVGCGSGILSLAAVALGAESVQGIDIDPDAVKHSRINAKVNGMEKKIRFMLPEEYVTAKKKTPLLVLMNMIHSEQTIAWGTLKAIHDDVDRVITSGILAADREDYLKLTRQWGWALVDERQNGEWIGLHYLGK